jgi:cyclic lactone autoinducer peptide
MKDKRILKFIEKAVSGLIAAFGIGFAATGANSACCFILHQPEKPELNRLRRF